MLTVTVRGQWTGSGCMQYLFALSIHEGAGGVKSNIYVPSHRADACCTVLDLAAAIGCHALKGEARAFVGKMELHQSGLPTRKHVICQQAIA